MSNAYSEFGFLHCPMHTVLMHAICGEKWRLLLIWSQRIEVIACFFSVFAMPKTSVPSAKSTPISQLSPKKLKTDKEVDSREVISCQIMRNGVIGVIFCDKYNERLDDGFWPFTVGLAKKGDNSYKV